MWWSPRPARRSRPRARQPPGGSGGSSSTGGRRRRRRTPTPPRLFRRRRTGSRPSGRDPTHIDRRLLGALAALGAVKRPRPPTSRGALLGVRGRSALPDHRDLDLARVLHLLRDRAGDLVRDESGLLVVHLAGINDHADLATGPHRVHALHSLVASGDLL